MKVRLNAFMPRFAANLSLLYPDLPFLERFEAAAQNGFEPVECLFPYAWPARILAAQLRKFGLQQVLFNAPAGGADGRSVDAAWTQGWRGLACLPGREAEFRYGVALALEYAAALDCPRIHVMAGLQPEGARRADLLPTMVANLGWAAQRAALQQVQITIEPINLRDMPCYFLHRQDQAHEILDALGASNLKVQMDLYHCQISEGDVAEKLRRYLPTGRIGHIQIAGVPERHEPDTGELNYSCLFNLLDESGYCDWVGCEYRPRRGEHPGGTSDGLCWLKHVQKTEY